MFKRRLAILGAVGVLVVTGLTGSALAGTTPPAPEGTVTCTTGDGKVVYSGVTAKAIEVVKGADGEVVIKESAEPVRVVMKATGATDADVLVQSAEGTESETIRATRLEDGVQAGAVRAVPAEPLPQGAKTAEPLLEAAETAAPLPEGAELGESVIMCRSEAAAE